MNDRIIREALPEDAEILLEYMRQIGRESDNLTYGSDGISVTPEQEKAFLQQMRQEEHAVFLCAWQQEALIGTGSLSPLPRRMSHRAELSISVVKKQWGNGTGSMLMEALITYAKSHGIELLNLEVRSDNTRAIHLYQKYGFKTIGTSPAFFKIGSEYADFELMYLDLR